MITRRSGTAERSARLTSGLSGLVQVAAEEVTGRDGLTRKHGKELMSFRYHPPVSPQGPSTFIQVSDWTK